MLLLVATLVTFASAESQTLPLWSGTWELASESTTYAGPPAYKRATYRIEPDGDGMRVVYDAVLSRGGTTHLEWSGKLDGRARDVQGSDEYLTYAYREGPEGTWELTARIDGRIVATAKVTFSVDGRTMTTVTEAVAEGKPIVTTTIYRKVG